MDGEENKALALDEDSQEVTIVNCSQQHAAHLLYMRSFLTRIFVLKMLVTQEVPQIDPRTLKPDLYAAAAANDIEKVAVLLDEAVPATFIEIKTGYTVSPHFSFHFLSIYSLSTLSLFSSQILTIVYNMHIFV